MAGGNQIKYVSFKFAFWRMEEACRAGYFLESVMIAESVISDRLHSGTTIDDSPSTSAARRSPNLNRLIKSAVARGLDPALAHELNTWRRARNIVAHQLARSWPGEATIPVPQFLMQAEETAKRGILLAKKVKAWQQKQKATRPSSRRASMR